MLFLMKDGVVIYFDLNIDTLYLKLRSDASMDASVVIAYADFAQEHPDFMMIEHLAIDIHPDTIMLFIIKYFIDKSRPARNLKEIVVACSTADYVGQEVGPPGPAVRFVRGETVYGVS
jgi:hypothetical protein